MSECSLPVSKMSHKNHLMKTPSAPPLIVNKVILQIQSSRDRDFQYLDR